MIHFLERRLWLSLLLLGVLLAILGAAVTRLGGAMPVLRPLETQVETPPAFPAFREVGGWFAITSVLAATNGSNPFFTLHFQPAPPPPTKKLALLYQGGWISSKDERRAYLTVGDQFRVLTNGATVVADHAISEITLEALTLTNVAGQTNVLHFNVSTNLEVPAS